MKNEKTLELYKQKVLQSANVIHFNDLTKRSDFTDAQHVDTKIWSAKKVITEYGDFYLAPEGFTEKEIIDAEVFTSQIYKIFGFENTPFYFPVLKGNKYTVMCNDIKNNRNEIAENVHARIKNNTGLSREEIEAMFKNKNIFRTLYPKYFSTQCLKNKIKLRLIDAALNVTNRDYNQIMYTMTKLGKATDITPLTGGISGLNFLRKKDKMRGEPVFQSEFTTKNQTRSGLLESFANSKIARTIFDNSSLQEFMNTLESIDYKTVAQDIKANLHYEIDPNYISYMEENKEQFLDDMHEKLYQFSAKTEDINSTLRGMKRSRHEERQDKEFEM